MKTILAIDLGKRKGATIIVYTLHGFHWQKDETQKTMSSCKFAAKWLQKS